MVVRDRGLGRYDPFKSIGERVAAVRDAQGTGWWVIYHGTDDRNFIKFKMDGDQFSPLVVQPIGGVHEGILFNPGYSIGEMCFSPQGDKLLLVSITGIVDLFDFDRCTGDLSNWDSLGTPSPNYPGPDNYYGCSFSPDGTKIYVSEGSEPPIINRIFQYDLNAPDVRASKTLIFTAQDSIIIGQHQLGPDGKIYITQRQPLDSLAPDNYYLSVINDPNQAGLACNFSYASLWLKGRRTSYGLPNLANYNLPPMVAQVAEAGPRPPKICPGDSVRIGYPDSTGGVVEYRWWPHTGVADTTAAYTWASPDSTTWYYLTAVDTQMGLPCGKTVDSVLVEVVASGELPVANVGADTTICTGTGVTLDAGLVLGWEYLWSNGDSLAQITISGAGAYSVTVTNPADTLHCYKDVDTILLSNYPAPQPLPADFAGGDTVACKGDTVRLGMVSVPGWNYLWSPGGWLDSVTVAAPLSWSPVTVEYAVVATDSASGGVCAAVADSILVTVEQPLVHEAPGDVTFCRGECFEIGVASVAGLGYLWSPITGLSNPTASLTRAQPAATTVYTLTVTNPAMQSANCRERRFMVVATADACNRPTFIAVNGNGVAEVLDLGDHAGRVELRVWDVAGRYVHRDMDYRNDWSAAGLARGVYIYTVAVLGDCPSSFTGKIVVQR